MYTTIIVAVVILTALKKFKQLLDYVDGKALDEHFDEDGLELFKNCIYILLIQLYLELEQN